MLGFFKNERQMSFNYSFEQATGNISIAVSSKLANLHKTLKSTFFMSDSDQIVLFLLNQENPEYKIQLTEDVLENLKAYTSTLANNYTPAFEIKVLHIESFEVKARPKFTTPQAKPVEKPTLQKQADEFVAINGKTDDFMAINVNDKMTEESFKKADSVMSDSFSDCGSFYGKFENLDISDPVVKKVITENQVIRKESPENNLAKKISLYPKKSKGFLPNENEGNYNVTLAVENNSHIKIDKSFHLKKLKGNCESPDSYNVPIIKPGMSKDFGIQLCLKKSDMKCVWAIVSKQNDEEVLGNFVLFETVNAGIRLSTIDHLKFKKINI